MKTLTLAGLCLIGAAVPAHPQAPAPGTRPPLLRGDVAGTVAWHNVDISGIAANDRWENQILSTGLMAGRYWTEHLKTEVEAAYSTDATFHGSRSATVNGRDVFVSSEYRLRTARAGVTQLYQFGRNQWFHPFLGAGLDVVFDRVERRDHPAFVYHLPGGVSPIRPPEDRAVGRHTALRAAAVGGFKAYLTPHAFVRTDMRFVFGAGLDEVLVRFGIGVDF